MAADQFEGLSRFSVKGPGIDLGRVVDGHVRLSEHVVPAGPVIGGWRRTWTKPFGAPSIEAIAKTLDPPVPSR